MEKYLPGTSRDLLLAFFNGGNAQGMSSQVIAAVIKEICAIEETYGTEVRS